MEGLINIGTKHDKWEFSAIRSIEEYIFNSALEKFYNLGIKGLVRENIQNSLDAKIIGDDSPVVVIIKTGTIKKEAIPGLDEVKNRISSLNGHNSYTKETIKHMQNKMVQENVDFISFEDRNTKGLRGANNGQSDSKEDTWGIYAYNKGVHSEEEIEEVEKSRGGSHGIGKIASNAASDLHMMFFANCDEEGNKHLGGTVQLIEHKYKDNYYRSTGYFTDIKEIGDKYKFYPYKNEFDEVFSKDTRGLKIIIPFLREQFNNENEIIKSIFDSFFIAVIQNKLQVIVNDKEINSETIKKYILSEEYYVQGPSQIKDEFTPLYFKTYMDKEPISLEVADTKQKYNFNLYFTYDNEIAKGRVAIIRTIGMKIEDKKVKGNVNKPFNAVLIPKSMKEDEFIKSLENESHTELSFEHIKDQKLQRNAKRFINNISNEIARIIEDEIKKNNPTDGAMDTKDILYIIENKFKKDLLDSMPTVKLKNSYEERTVVKINDRIPKKQDQKDKKDKKKKKRSTGVKRVKRNGKSEGDSNEKGIVYSASPDIVDRIVISDKEIVKFDFSHSDDMKGIKSCNISLSIVDGMGVEYHNEFNLNSNYEYVIDKMTGNKCVVEGNSIKGIKIIKGIAKIELKTKSNFNKALKFMYYVEV